MIDAFFKGLFMAIVLNLWIRLGSKLWKVVEVEELEDEEKSILISITFSDKENEGER